MKTSGYDLKFTVASRTLFSRKLCIVHWDAFGKATSSNFPQLLPSPDGQPIDGYLVHSVEIAGAIEPTGDNNAYLLYVLQEYPRYITRFTGSFEDFLGTKSAKTRATLRKKVRNFAKAGEVDEVVWHTYSTPDEIADFMKLAIPLAKRTYQARLFDGALPDSREFLEQSIQSAENSSLKAYLLFLNGNAVAYLYAPIRDGAMIYAYLGYDEEVANLSPGTVLQFLVHESLFKEQSVLYFDFTEGDGAHKALFATEQTRCCNILYLKNTLENRCLVGAHRRWNKSVEFLRDMAGKTKLKQRIKGALRKSPGH